MMKHSCLQNVKNRSILNKVVEDSWCSHLKSSSVVGNFEAYLCFVIFIIADRGRVPLFRWSWELWKRNCFFPEHFWQIKMNRKKNSWCLGATRKIIFKFNSNKMNGFAKNWKKTSLQRSKQLLLSHQMTFGQCWLPHFIPFFHFYHHFYFLKNANEGYLISIGDIERCFSKTVTWSLLLFFLSAHWLSCCNPN